MKVRPVESQAKRVERWGRTIQFTRTIGGGVLVDMTISEERLGSEDP